VCVRVCVCDGEARERERVCVTEREASVCVCVTERERSKCLCVCHREREASVCVCDTERRKRESAVPVLKWCTAFFVLNFSFKFVVAKNK